MRSPSGVAFFHHNLLLTFPVHEQQQEGCDGKEYAIHDPESKARLEHYAWLIDVCSQRTCRTNAVRACVQSKGRIGAEIHTFLIGDGPEFVHPSDESADKAKVDEGDEYGGFAGGLAAE